MHRAVLASAICGWLVLSGFNASDGDYPVVVVGSGFGGSIAAYNLASAGVPTLVLERGRWWTVEDPTRDATFATLPSALEQDGRAAWLSDVCLGSVYLTFFPPENFPCEVTTGVFEVLDAVPNLYDRSPAIRVEGTAVLVGAGVGGGSLVSNGLSYAPLKAAWDVAFPPTDLPHMQLVWHQLNEQGHFRQVLDVIAPSPVPEDILATRQYEGTRLMRDDAVAAGYPMENGTPGPLHHGTAVAPVAVDWEAVREELSGLRVPAVTIGESSLGINSGAKRSLDKADNYLGLARATGNVEIRALHTVTRIRFDPDTELYTLEVLHTDPDYKELEQFSVTTRHLIMSAGSIGTTKLLVRARETGDLPRLNHHIGTRWSSNGNSASYRIVTQGVASQGGPAGMKIVNYDDPQNPVVLGNLAQRVPAFFANEPVFAPFLGALFVFGLGIPTSTGSFHYDAASDSVVLTWPPEAGRRVYDKFVGMLNELSGTPYILEQSKSQAITAHPLGGVPLGLATDLDCRLYGYDNLYAVDGSIVPGAGAATAPSILISALAQRCMSRITGAIRRDLHRKHSHH